MVDCINEAVVVTDSTCTYDDNVVSEVVSGTVFVQHICIQVLELIWVSFLWLSHHMLSESVEVGLFKQRAFVVFMVLLMLLCHFLLGELDFGGVKGCVAEGISEKGDSTVNVTFHAL